MSRASSYGRWVETNSRVPFESNSEGFSFVLEYGDHSSQTVISDVP